MGSPLFDTLAFYSQRLVPATLSVAMLPWLFERCGATVYQHYSIALLTIGTAAMFFGSWVSQAGMRNLGAAGYDRHSLRLTASLVGASALAAALATMAALRWLFPESSSTPWLTAIAAGLFTMQSATLPLLQAVGKHLACLVSELFRTVGTVAIVVWLTSPPIITSSTVELALALGTALSVASLIGAAITVWRAASDDNSIGPLRSRTTMWAYGGPLSVYNGLSMWLQYLARTSLVALTGAAAGGAQVFVADMAQKLIASVSGPLIASQVPRMIAAHNDGQRDLVNRKIIMLHRLVAAAALALAFLTCLLALAGLWLFRSREVSVCALISIGANATLQLAVCAQKRLEFDGRTGRVAIAMGAAAVGAFAAVRLLPLSLRITLPGVELLCGAVILYVCVRYFNSAHYGSLAKASAR